MENHTHVSLKGGVIGGLVGGMLFGMMMFMMGKMPMIAMMVGSQSVMVGWVLHLLISAGAGAAFALIFAKQIHSLKTAIIFGAVYGVGWWVLGALILMPMILGMEMQLTAMFAQSNMMSLMGHLIFGIVLAVVAWKVK